MLSRDSEADIAAKVALWHEAFANTPFAVVLDAVNTHIATSKYAPTVAEIRENVVPKATIGSGDYSPSMLVMDEKYRMTPQQTDAEVQRLLEWLYNHGYDKVTLRDGRYYDTPRLEAVS